MCHTRGYANVIPSHGDDEVRGMIYALFPPPFQQMKQN